MKALSSLLLAMACGSSFAGDGANSSMLSEPDSGFGWNLSSISAGAGWRSFGSLDYKGGTRSQDLYIPSVVGGDALSLPSIGAPGVVGDRTYLNGFVNVDGSGSADGDTWYWGYDSSGQVSGDVLSFNALGSRSSYSESSDFFGRVTGDDRLESFSPQVDLLFLPTTPLPKPFEGVLVSFWVFGDDQNHRYSNFTAQQERLDYRKDFTDQFDIGPINPIIDAPYAGSFDGPGPLISNLPFDRSEVETLIDREDAVFNNSVSTSLDLDGYSLAFGPTMMGRIADNWSWRASAGLTINVFKWNAKESETLSLSIDGGAPTEYRSWRDSKSGSDFRLGVYAKGEMVRDFSNDWFAKAYFQRGSRIN